MSEELKEDILSNKYFVLVLVLVVGIVLFSIMAKLITNVTYKKDARTRVPSIDSATSIYIDGKSWREIATYDMSETDKVITKSTLIRLIIETSIINNTPVINPGRQLPEYIKAIDSIYENPADQNIPLYFALRIADMRLSGAPENAIKNYTLLVQQKLYKAVARK